MCDWLHLTALQPKQGPPQCPLPPCEESLWTRTLNKNDFQGHLKPKEAKQELTSHLMKTSSAAVSNLRTGHLLALLLGPRWGLGQHEVEAKQPLVKATPLRLSKWHYTVYAALSVTLCMMQLMRMLCMIQHGVFLPSSKKGKYVAVWQESHNQKQPIGTIQVCNGVYHDSLHAKCHFRGFRSRIWWSQTHSA